MKGDILQDKFAVSEIIMGWCCMLYDDNTGSFVLFLFLSVSLLVCC